MEPLVFCDITSFLMETFTFCLYYLISPILTVAPILKSPLQMSFTENSQKEKRKKKSEKNKQKKIEDLKRQ